MEHVVPSPNEPPLQWSSPKEKAVATVTVRIPEARRALEQLRREEREGKVRCFKSARDAVARLKRL